MSPLRFVQTAFLVLLLTVSAAAQKKNEQMAPRTEAEILKTVKLPEGYEATVFALPPMGGYPTSVSAATDGTIFVAVDENGSLGRDRNPASGLEGPKDGRIPGKVVRMRDIDGDGRADEFQTFCEVESPRGVIWDAPSGTAPGTLYVMHPPNLTAYTDTDGDGKSDQQEDILTGLGFGLDFRGADHTTNGARLAIDGFIYIAVGDYGFTKAVAKDGTTLSMRGGGIVRIRPDGTGFEIVSRGQRNIYDVAVSPTLDLFTRDNTNDGGGWNVRLSFVPPGAHMGYPYLFKNFSEDMFQPLADLGGGSPCGALWLDEPGLPKGLFTVEWGAGGIMYHDDLVPAGAGWKVAQPAADADPTSTHKRPPLQQNKWIAMTRPTDMDVNASGALFITSWEGATFNYNGPNAGYVLRVVKKDAPKVAVPDLGKMTSDDVARLLASESATLRMAAQRELLRREDAVAGLLMLNNLAFKANNQAVRVAALETHAQWLGRRIPKIMSRPQVDSMERIELMFVHLLAFLAAGGDADAIPIQAAAVQILGSDPRLFVAETAAGIEKVLRNALGEKNPRVRAAAITALRRLAMGSAGFQPAAAGILGAPSNAVPGRMPETAGRMPALPGSILPLVADADPVVAHLAVRALSELKAVQPCLAALDSADTKIQPGALRALYGIYTPEVVDGLIARLRNAQGSAGFQPAAGGILPGAEARIGSPAIRSAADAQPSGRMPEATGRMPALPDPSANADGSFSLRRGILNALCRLANQDAPYEDPKVWWGTRPDTSGPVYQPIAWSETPKITAALKTALEASNEDDAKWLVARMYATKVAYPGLVELMLAKAGGDTPAKLTALEGMIRADNSLPPEGVAALQAIATNDSEAPDLRVRALRIFQKCADHGSVFPGALAAFAPLAGHDIPDAKINSVFEDFTRGSANEKWVGAYAEALAGDAAPKRLLAATVLVNLATGKVGKEQERDAAKKAVEKGFAKPESAAALLTAIARTGAKPLAAQVKAHLNHPHHAVAESALFAYQKLGLKETGAPTKTIGELKYDEVFAAVQEGGDAKAGQELFLRAACIACHTIQADEPPKGPILSAVAKIYDRAALTESILKPNAKMAQGFESAWIKTKKGEQFEGFVTREGGDNLDLRNIAGQTVLIEKADIAERGHREQSMMPEGLMNAFTPRELADLLAWMESLKK